MRNKKANYHWIGIDGTGRKIIGSAQFIEKNKLINQLQHKNITLLSIQPQHLFSLKKRKTLSQHDKLYFMQQLQLLLHSGLSLKDALSVIQKMKYHSILENMINDIQAHITYGGSLSSAFSLFPSHFDATFCDIVHAGEISGQLETVLMQLIQALEHQIAFKQKLKKTLFYPSCVTAIAILISIGLLIFIIPQFQSIYKNFDAQLPFMTKQLITISQHIRKNGFIYACISIFSLLLLKNQTLKIATIKQRSLHVFLKIPFIQSTLTLHHVTQWAELMTITLTSGIPLIEALTIVHRTFSQPLLESQLTHVKHAVIQGKSLYAALESWRVFPLQAKIMIGIGENADALPEMMKKIALYHQKKLHSRLDYLSKLLEPVIMILVATMVSGLIIALYLPLFRMGSII